MIKNYFKIALRNLIKNKLYALINVFGITIATAVVLLSATFIYQEYSYDNFHEETDTKYRLLRKNTDAGFVAASFPGYFYIKPSTEISR